MEVAIQYKTNQKMTKSQYKNLRRYLSKYLILPSYGVLAKKITELMPTKEAPKDFLMNGVQNGKFWSP